MYIINILPTSILLGCVGLYNKLSSFSINILKQINKSYNALNNSLQTDNSISVFFKGIPIPVSYEYFIENTDYNNSDLVEWYYIKHINLFIKSIEHIDQSNNVLNPRDLRKLYWLGVSLHSNDDLIQDISNFIETVRYISDDFLPPTPEILVSAWCYENRYMLNKDDTYIHITSSDANEYVFPLQYNNIHEDDWKQSLTR